MSDLTSPTKKLIRSGDKQHKAELAKIRLNCAHEYVGDGSNRERYAVNGELFEVVPTPKRGSHGFDPFNWEKKDDISIYYQGDGKRTAPDSIMVVRESDGDEQFVRRSRDRGGNFVYRFSCEYTKSDFENILEKKFWLESHKPEVYTVQGLPKDLTVNVYSPHQWKLSVSFPPFRKLEVGYKLNKDNGEKFRKKKEITDQGEAEYLERIHYDEQEYPSSDRDKRFIEIEKLDEHSSDSFFKRKLTVGKVGAITLEKDGKSLIPDALVWFESIIVTAAEIYKIFRKIKDQVPSIGWYFDFELQLMQGIFNMEWGWKEYSDHRAYFNTLYQFNVEIFYLSFEIGAGVSGLGSKAQVYANLAGSISTSQSANKLGTLQGNGRNAPDDVEKISVDFEGLIEGALGIRVEVGAYVKLLSAKGEAKTGVKADGLIDWDIKKGVSVHGKVSWTGAKVVLEYGIGKGGAIKSGKKTFVLAEPEELKRFDWPEPAKKYNPPTVTDDRLHQILKKRLNAGFNIRVILPGKRFYLDTHYKNDDIANFLLQKIRSRKDIMQDEKTMEGLAHDLRGNLDLMGKRKMRRDWVHIDHLLDFIHNGEMDKILDNYIDPCLILKNQMGSAAIE